MPATRPYKKNPYKRRPRTLGGKVRKIVKNALKKQEEPKWIQPAFPLQTVPTYTAGPIVNCLSLITQGDANFQRDGNQVKFKHMRVNLAIHYNFSATGQNKSQRVRIVAFTWNTPKVAPTEADLFGTAPVDALNDPINANWFRYKKGYLLKDIRTYVSEQYSTKNLTINKKCNVPCVYNGVGSTLTEREKGQIYLLIFGDVSLANNPPTISMSSNLLFSDI